MIAEVLPASRWLTSPLRFQQHSTVRPRPRNMEQVFKRDFASLDAIFGFTNEFLGRERVSDEAAYAVNLAVEELFTNMVKYNTGGGGEITIRITKDRGDLTLQLVDTDVDPFDPAGVKQVDPTSPIDARRPGGLGLHLVKSVVDRISYEYKDRRMTVTIVKGLEN